ncbi:hypothetical protein QAD02_016448 [Eretmocerus hayati]|uniref:Uncharacterized protein n=1 Tax=Eretmocerus hayati TaxID=131215 RepID=A0ACC2PB44_9HYME|nr:hypothetical protein QAD02_016448 [Eretmocerus hayati]
MKRKLARQELRSNSDKDDDAGKEDEIESSAKRKRLNLWESVGQLCGFQIDELGFDTVVEGLYKPADPSSLGVIRALFGLCMVFDVVDERGLANIDLKWGDPYTCHFPLMHGMRPMSLPYMIVLYSIMWLGAFGIMLGFHYKLACCMFVLPYWYILLLDKSFWNNHSYLFGVVSLLFCGTNANEYFSVDAWLSRTQRGNIPTWNYFILKFQFFILYFIAGLKKSSREWLEGYAMSNLSKHWVFDPFRLILTGEQTDLYIVHWFAFVFDLTVGFFMLWDKTRMLAFLFCITFHLMNSRLFSIGMFPYVCLATMPLFCRNDWPRKLLLPSKIFRSPTGDDAVTKEEEVEPEKETLEESSPHERNCNAIKAGSCGSESAREPKIRKRFASRRVTNTQRLVVALLIFHMALQLFLPYSHFITQGYNNWVPGLYGYSWDMMVHAWDTILIVVRIRDNKSQKDYFLDPETWTLNDRWAKHGDMVRQYAHCIKENLQKLKGSSTRVKGPWANLSSDLSIYADVWCSLNGRFQQRLFNPHVDLLKAEWHPLKPVSYLMPLLRQFSSYRSKLERIEREVHGWSNYTGVLFVADYPGLVLENYVANDLSNVSLRVLEGEITYREDTTTTTTMMRMTLNKGGGTLSVPSGSFHWVETTSLHPACYMYTFYNGTKHQLARQGIVEPVKTEKVFPLMAEIRHRIDGFGRAVGHITNALLHLTLDIPMIRRVPLD